jgi:REP element-mobilizing transposase RayT
MVRGLDRQTIFRADEDRYDFVDRLAKACESTGLAVLAWALVPNHLHLLVRTGHKPLASGMRRLLTGYAVRFNRRYRRTGHLLQNRYKSILVEEERYLHELVRYIHLNPLRLGIVPDLSALDRFPWTGHSAILGVVARPWQAVEEVLGQFGTQMVQARRAYRAFIRDGIALGRRPEFQGGGLRRSAGGWQEVEALQRGRERWASDERVLGSSEFVQRVLSELVSETACPGPKAETIDLAALIERVANRLGMSVAECCSGSRRKAVVAARDIISKEAVSGFGLSVVTVARALGVSSQTVLAGLARTPSQ